MSVVAPIKIDGVRDLQAALRAMDGETQKQLRVVFNEAADLVADTARPRVPRATGRAAASVRAKSGQREAIVVGGSAKVPYYVFLEGGTNRPYRRAGKYLPNAYDANRARIEHVLADGLTDLVTRSGLAVD